MKAKIQVILKDRNNLVIYEGIEIQEEFNGENESTQGWKEFKTEIKEFYKREGFPISNKYILKKEKWTFKITRIIHNKYLINNFEKKDFAEQNELLGDLYNQKLSDKERELFDRWYCENLKTRDEISKTSQHIAMIKLLNGEELKGDK